MLRPVLAALMALLCAATATAGHWYLVGETPFGLRAIWDQAEWDESNWE